MKAIFLRVGERTAAGYPLELFEGEQDALLERIEGDNAADALETIPLNAEGTGPDLGAGAIRLSTILDLISGHEIEGASLTGAGTLLFGLLNRGAVGKRWLGALKNAKKQWYALRPEQQLTAGVQLRTYLDVRDPYLARLPWELVRDEGDMLALHQWAPLTRYSSSTPAARREDLELRVLLVIGCHPKAAVGIAWVDELRSFLTSVCRQRDAIDFEVFEAFNEARDPRAAVTLKGELRQAIATFRPHVLHFVGHGRSEGGTGALELFDFKANDVVPWTSQELKNWLEATPPAVVLLNACRTSEAAADPEAAIAALASMTGAALGANVGCVVSMQHDIEGEAAAHFAEGFYETLARRQAVDVAVINGRKRIADAFPYENRNWALPVCTVSAPPETLLPARDRISPQRLTEVQSHPDIAPLLSFVDRRRERRTIIHPTVDALNRNVAFVVSETKMGKSSLARVIARWRWLTEQRVVYVDFGIETPQRAPRDVIEILRHMRGRDEASGDILRPNIHRAFGAFHDAVNAILDDKPLGAIPASGIDKGLLLDRNKVTSARAWDVVFDGFLSGLKSLAKERPMTLVLDHLTKLGAGVVPDDFKEHIVKRLIQPIHRGDVAGVTMVVAATANEIDQCGLTALRTSSVGVSLGNFAFEHWELLAREFVVREGMESIIAEETIRKYTPLLNEKPWKPRWFLRLKEDYEEFVGTRE
ncbi:MAG: CHAT domain-containing protein [Cytophagaceae bacterium]|nr:CHAT domain-containing protein [Gemmatimonadaceae bacterium]